MPIVENTHPCWGITCDTCGEGDNTEYGGSFHHVSRADAIAAARDTDMTVSDDGKVECLDCHDQRKLNEDNEIRKAM